MRNGGVKGVHDDNPYKQLWEQVDEALEKDLPQDAMRELARISERARADGRYGHLMRAQLTDVQVRTMVSPDSLPSAVARIEATAEGSEGVLRAVYAAVLGRLYHSRWQLGEDHEERSQRWYAMAMADADLLAGVKAEGYEPLVVTGADSEIFGDDLLHVIGREAGADDSLYDYYRRSGNRRAACLTALWAIKAKGVQGVKELRSKGVKDDSYVNPQLTTVNLLDSLIVEYGDLQEAGALAVARYETMKDSAVSARVAFINNALSRWGEWKGMNSLRNELQRITMPRYELSVGSDVVTVGKPGKVVVSSLCNLRELRLCIRRLKVDGDTQLNPMRTEDYEALLKRIDERMEERVYVKQFGSSRSEGVKELKDYEVVSDTIFYDALPVGVYLLTVTTDNGQIDEKRALLRVSNLRMLWQELPGRQVRLAVVDALSGQPVGGAKVRLRWRRYDKQDKTETLTCNARGETIYKYDKEKPDYVWPFTADDRAMRESGYSSYFSYSPETETRRTLNLYTDRRLYRPGQTVHVAAMVYDNVRRADMAAVADERLTLVLRDANDKEVARRVVTTDGYGVASADFDLPSSGLTGRFSVYSQGDVSGSVAFSVEEYKRPTFKVEFDRVADEYAVGDTVEVKGYARSFAGVPVQGATVRVTYSRRPAFWWYRDTSGGLSGTLADSLTTDDDGCFKVRLPLLMPETEEKRPRRYYRFDLLAEVTDVAGEMRSGETSVPLSDRPTAFSCSLPSKSLRDKLRTLSFSYVNNAGMPIDGLVSYCFDGGKTATCKANEATDVSKLVNSLEPGRHTLTAVCGTDTLEASVVLFTLDDRRPVIQTHDWFYQSASKFPDDGQPIYIQIGSSDPDQHILYSIIAGNKVIESGHIDQSNALTTRKFAYKEEYGDGITLSYSWIKNDVVYEHEAHIEKPLPDKRLLLKWTTFRDKLKPGQQEEWTLSIAHPDGKPAQAQMMAVLYDKSLDMIQPHSWSFSPWLYRQLANADWRSMATGYVSLSGARYFLTKRVESLALSHFDESLFSSYYHSRYRVDRLDALGAGVAPMALESRARIVEVNESAVSAKGAKKVLSMADAVEEQAEEPQAEDKSDEGKKGKDDGAQMRENLAETAFFYPDLLTDGEGNVAIRFTLPESVTTWKFMGLAHDKAMNYGQIGGETVAQKTVMVQPNVPRFVRAGDKAQISTRIFNTSEQTVSGAARLQLLDPENEQVITTVEKPYTVEAKKTGSATFEVDMAELSSSNNSLSTILICRIMAEGADYSDGEQHYLPVMPDKELVTNTFAITQHEPETTSVDLNPLLPVRDKTSKLTIEYTNHPVWLLIQALPTMATTRDDNAVSLSMAYYANSIASYLLHLTPTIKETIGQWQLETGKETSLMSSLQKNESLKNLLLNETPWVLEAEDEAEQKRLLMNYFDESAVNHRLESYLKKLKKLQNSNGSFSWWPGMRGSVWMTAEVCQQLIRLNVMLGKQDDTEKIISKGLLFLADEIKQEVKELKIIQKKGKIKWPRPSELAIDYLYTCAIDGRQMSVSQQADINYLVSLLEKQTTEFSIYGKARSSIIFAKFGKAKKAVEYLESIRQYTVYTKEMGRYFDTPKALYSWRDYRIPSQVAAIEALKALAPGDKPTISEMQRWLLQEKRTQAWDTPINSVNAVFAFLDGEMDKLQTGEPSTMRIDGQVLEMPKATAGLGYVKTTIPADDAQTLTVEKTSEGTSWGAVYAQFMQTSTEVSDASTGLAVSREIRKRVGSEWVRINDKEVLHVGDRVKVRITIQADRDYDFVQLIDKRAACFEPINQLSGYHWPYYCSPRDNTTNYYFDVLAKGKHIVEAEYNVDRAGRYQTGNCTVQCAYSPEFSAREKAKVLTVVNQ